MKKYLLSSALLLGVITLSAQGEQPKPLIISGYAEAYYIHDFSRPVNNSRPGFIYSHKRTNEVNINLAFIKAGYTTEKLRANFAIAAGTYMNANYAAEPGVLKNILEANIGIKISNRHNLWIDVGVMPSHIGLESAVGKDCWTLTRSMAAENSPYFETGAKISYTSPDEKWLISALVLNGWQRIQRIDGNSTPAFGHQLTYKPNDNITLNSSSFIGSDKPDSSRQMRYFHNLYGIFKILEQFSITAGFDIGTEQKVKSGKQYNIWYAPLVLLRLTPDPGNSLNARLEYYSDANAVIISTGAPSGFKTWGYSLNYDHLVKDNIALRIEGRGLHSGEKIFEKKGGATANNFSVAAAIAVSF
ncbi:MAG: porin [Sphingobacteriales bacterium]|nr:porin [Sphingobacteriales bacterium]OJY92033.1 MAG: hypothetical protein BGP14_24320 [Sphingobacteriales bacterium 44-15]